MKIKAHILLNLISFFVALFAFPAMAQQYNIIYDVFTNENYSYQSKFKEIKDVGLNLNDDIDVTYFAFRNEQNNYFQINQKIEELAINSWQNDKSKLILQNEVKATLANYNKFKNSKNNRDSRGVNGRFGSIELKNIDVNILSVCKNVITFKQVFEFSIASNSNNYNDRTLEIYISHYYTADINNQSIHLLQHNFKDKDLLKLQQTIGPYVTQLSNEIKTQFSPEEIETLNENLLGEDEIEEYDNEDETPLNHQENNSKTNLKNENIDYNEANYYWYAWGLMVEFPAYSKSSNLSNGLAFTVFVPFDHCKNILDLFPSYESYRNLGMPFHHFNHFDYFDIINNYSKFRQEPKITSLFTLNNALDKPKKLTVGSYQTYKDNKKNHRGDFIYDFDVRAKNFQRSADNNNYTQFFENNNGKLTLQKNNHKADKNSLIYDEKGNLITRKFNDIESGGDYLFFYNQYNCYYFRSKTLSDKNQDGLMRLSLNKNELCLNDVCLLLNEKMQVRAVKSLRNQYSDTQLGFDHKDRLVEAHMENDRYNYYYEYDALDRLIKYSYYEYSRPEKEVEFFYIDKNRLPYLQKKHTVTNETFEEETYEWEY